MVMNMDQNYSLEDAINSYNWLGHEKWTEFVALSPEYKAGKENLEHNLEHKAFPIIWYARDQENAKAFIDKQARDRFVMLGLNDRPQIFKNDKGYARSALEKEIERSQNILFDFDPLNKEMSEKQRKAQAKAFANFAHRQAYEYFHDLGIELPTRVDSGNGYWFLFAHPPITVQEHPDIVERNRQFARNFRDEFRLELENLELKLDDPGSLRKLIKVPGTAKPQTPERVSKFYGTSRVQDDALRQYLLNLTVQKDASTYNNGTCGRLKLNIGARNPHSLEELHRRYPHLRDLYEGIGKPDSSDTTPSGYDFAWTVEAIVAGYTNPDDLGTAIANRPGGSVKNSGRGLPYIHRTIANAMNKALLG